VGSNPDSSSRAIVLYQHHAPKPSPCIRTNFFVLTFSRNSGTCKGYYFHVKLLRQEREPAARGWGRRNKEMEEK